MRLLRAGLIGVGSMGRHHARVLSALEGVELVGIVDPAGVTSAAPTHLVPSVEDLVRRGVDYCVVAVPTVLHEEVGLQLAEAGVHVLMEKPLAVDLASARRLTEAFEARGLVGAVGHVERFNAALQQARKRMANGDLGQIYQVSTRRQGPFPARIADVGVVKDLATHDIDLTAWIAQSPYRTVSALTTFRAGREHEDLVAVVGGLHDGTVTAHLINWLSPLKERTTIITGERGALVADTLSADLTYYENGMVPSEWDGVAQFRGVSEGDVVRFAFPKPEPLRTENEAFRDTVLGRSAEIVTMREGLVTVAVAEAIIESAARRETVKIREVP